MHDIIASHSPYDTPVTLHFKDDDHPSERLLLARSKHDDAICQLLCQCKCLCIREVPSYRTIGARLWKLPLRPSDCYVYLLYAYEATFALPYAMPSKQKKTNHS